MNSKILILGAGHVGSAIALDLKKSGHKVKSIDIDTEKLQKLSGSGIETCEGDFTDNSFLSDHLEEADLVIGAAPGQFGFQLLEKVIRAGKNIVDISFCPEDYLELDQLARVHNVTVITDAGVAPGMCNIILGYHDKRMKVKSYKCLVGGLPVKREWPLEYKLAWSPLDVIEEYTRPARFREKGELVIKPALSDAELVNLEPVGTLEEWNSDGLRSLLTTMPHIPNLIEKTLRYPGTVQYLKVLRELGYFSVEEMDVRGKKIRPLDLSAELLFRNWKRKPGDSEFTIMRIIIEGEKKDEGNKYIYDLYDEYDPETDTLSMARTTGYTCTAAAELVLKGMFKRVGVSPPEYLGEEEENFQFVLNYLKKRQVEYRCLK